MTVATDQVEANGAMLACVKASGLYFCQDED